MVLEIVKTSIDYLNDNQLASVFSEGNKCDCCLSSKLLQFKRILVLVQKIVLNTANKILVFSHYNVTVIIVKIIGILLQRECEVVNAALGALINPFRKRPATRYYGNAYNEY